LSLGVDLGFGQPMEHVLRQCLIALRLAGHADAHEQAKWFGDDITLKSGKHAYQLGSVRGALATMRLVGAGNPPLHRFRVGLEFAFSGHRELDGMISQLAEFTEVAHRVGGVAAATTLARRRACRQAGSSTRPWPSCCAPGRVRYSAVSTRFPPGRP
ncbi:MAG: hypothetical protein ACRDL9_01945, partial [Trebonia sp.]